MGDFNYDLLASDTNISANDFLETFLSASFLPLISRPTRITNTSATLIDNFFSNIRSEFKAGIVISDISDHFPIFIYCSNQYQANNFPNYVPKRHVYSDVNISRLKQSLEEESWDDVFSTECVDESYEIFIEIFMRHVNENIPFAKPNSKKYKKITKTTLDNEFNSSFDK